MDIGDGVAGRRIRGHRYFSVVVERQLVGQSVLQLELEKWIVRTQHYKIQRNAEHVAECLSNRHILRVCTLITRVNPDFPDIFRFECLGKWR